MGERFVEEVDEKNTAVYMRPILAIVTVHYSVVCLSVTNLSRAKKHLNRSRRRFGCGPKEQCTVWDPDTTCDGAILRGTLSVWHIIIIIINVDV